MSAPSEIQAQPEIAAAATPNYKLLRISCWVVALALAAAHGWAQRFTMNADGISYLDIGDAYWRGDWHNAINAYWSPLYSYSWFLSEGAKAVGVLGISDGASDEFSDLCGGTGLL